MVVGAFVFTLKDVPKIILIPSINNWSQIKLFLVMKRITLKWPFWHVSQELTFYIPTPTLVAFLGSPMDQHSFVFVTRGKCIKGKQCQRITIKNQIFVCVQNNLAYFPFMHCPLVGNQNPFLWILTTSNSRSPTCNLSTNKTFSQIQQIYDKKVV